MHIENELIWGKSEPRITLAEHMLSVGACTVVYLRAASSKGLLALLCKWFELEEDECVRCVAYVFSLHDIGKIHPNFLFRIEDVKQRWKEDGLLLPYNDLPKNDFRHEVFGRDVLRRIWKNNGLFSGKMSESLASVVRLHHQGKGDWNGDRNKEWDEIRQDMERRMYAVFQPVPIKENAEIHWDALGVLLTGLLILMDWVASSRTFGCCETAVDDKTCFEWAVRRAENVLTSFGLISEKEDAFPDGIRFDEFWPTIQRENMRPLQTACETLKDVHAQLTIIEAPPGEGKTEAALYLAGQLCRNMNKQGIYMALPTTATSNQMVGRVRELMKAHGLGETRLLHGSAWMLEKEDRSDTAFLTEDADDVEMAANWLKPLRRSLLSENAVGTIDQAMAAVLTIKYGMLRLTGLANKVLIVDEIHAYDAYMSCILERLFEWCKALNIPVILLSATLHRRQKENYLKCYTGEVPQTMSPDYPLITQVDDRGEIVEHHIGSTYMKSQCAYRALPMMGDARALAEYAMERTRDGGCYCVMLNTVNRAQEVFQTLIDMGETQVMLFHARFRMRRRADIEQACLKSFGRGGDRPKRMILVCTQVVEQSLDLDFDGMVSELAPVDLLIQRAGRLHRHVENSRPAMMRQPVLDVVVPGRDAPELLEHRFGVAGYVYTPAELHNTEEWLGSERVLRVPEDVRAVVDEVYESFDPEQAEAYVKMQVEEMASRVKAQGGLYRAPKSSGFFGTTPSKCNELLLDDCDELMFSGTGARTREAEDSVRVAFLPKDFDPSGTDREKAIKIMTESVTIRLTRTGNDDTMNTETKRVSPIKIKGCIVVSPEEDGTYLVGGRRFIADDMIGIREVKDET